MKTLFFFFVALSIFSCGQTKHSKATFLERAFGESLESIHAKKVQDSLARAFCNCLAEDSLTNEIRLKKLDVLLEQKVDINKPCLYSKSVTYKSAGNLLQNMGASLSNFIFRTHISKKSSNKVVSHYYQAVVFVALDTNMVHALIERGADAHLKTRNIKSLVQIWATEVNTDKLQLLVDWGVDLGKTEIGTVNEKTMAFLISKGAKVENIDKVAFFESENYQNMITQYTIPLEGCSAKEFKSIVEVKPFRFLSYQKAKLLLEAGAPIHYVDANMLESVIDMEFEYKKFRHRAKESRQIQKEWFQLLTKYKVNWNQCGNFGESILIHAIKTNDINAVQFLLDKGVEIDFNCPFAGQAGKTPLEVAKKQVELWKDGRYEEKLEAAKKVLTMIEAAQ